MYPDDLRDQFEKKSRAGDGTFAIAYALLELADVQSNAAVALHGLGNPHAATSMGAIESLALEVRGIAKAIGELVSAK